MRPGAHAAAAIEILSDTETRRRPAGEAVKDWMLSHRFAGARDRAFIGDIVFGALRWRASSAWRLGDDAPRAWVLGALRWGFGAGLDEVERLCADGPHAPPPPSEQERAALAGASLENAPDWVRGDYPEWLDASMARTFGEDRAAEGAALAAPAPLDLRANTLKTERAALMAALADDPAVSEPPSLTPYSPWGVRLAWRRGRTFAWAKDPRFTKGWFEVQDEASQLCVLLSGAKPGFQVADVCSGGGGKALALAAMMENKGQIYAYDIDPRRLSPLSERAQRAGARNIQLRSPSRSKDVLHDLQGHMDLVFVDAPCTGSGTWRRAPDSKWRVRPNALKTRQEEQQAALALAAPLVKLGGLLAYVTCSVLPEENEDSVRAFLERAPGFAVAPLGADLPPARPAGPGLQLSPGKTLTDGFFMAHLRRIS